MATTLSGLILIVDDIPTNLDVISEALSNEGYKVAIATSGERALQQIERRPPDLILLDVMMPGIDGFETCQRLKANPKTCDIPVIFMTALADVDNKVKGLKLGAVDYVTKPFQEEEVLARVKTHLQLRLLSQNLEQQVAQKTAELRATQMQVIQREKMSALGELVAGVAHEINNPVGFLSGNIQHALENIKDLFGLLDLVQQESANFSPAIQDKIEAIDLEYIREDLPKLVGSMREGVNRIKDISISLRTFSRADSDRPIPGNIHDGIDSTIMILKHRLKASDTRPEIQVIKEYGNLPQVECYAGQLNQVFMNLLANAIDALEESNPGRSYAEIKINPNQIIINTELSEDMQQAIIRIKDNGIGMSEAVREKIFNELFTTKEVGKGTGLGLAIVRQIIIEKHGGTITVNSELAAGTEFVITLPTQAEQTS
ncbi:hybrid sensor histidine kinase/response regulator [Nostoc sp. 'Peltigera membranacea cyanobiont' 213]|uniref:sensor histidine kinase n=1 Tax=Nostoc sp. 'Peltigera membranacea cyanobiont' 213 TaxID=2014530 RepID=UPI000B95965A|nr:response regulator [Nostoc sp. 'Peltigera membranacea cyanobiont' 213]OYD88162.1 hybrid sensor histidine kinase/response regulator [Nostoc sp. 'Peltigera membranacea cyanobiont' 213]